MKTPRSSLLLCCWLLAGCGGNFSNEDIEFLNAVPVREELASKLPGGGTAAALNLERRVDALAQGEPSSLYADTRKASQEFNGALEAMLSTLEQVRRLPPTVREPLRRVWGPWPDASHPEHEVRFVMERHEEHFTYRVQFHETQESELEWWTLMEGTFEASGGLRKGEGALELRLSEARARGFEVSGLSGVARLEVSYQTQAPPLSVEMRFVPEADGSEVRYEYRELPEGLGELRFEVEGLDIVPGPLREELSIRSRWTEDRGGVGTVEVTGGDVPSGLSASQVECWDAAFGLTYAARSWDTVVVGTESSCPDVSALGQ